MYTFEKLENGFEYVVICNDAATAKIALQGAHIFEHQYKDEKSLLWLSPESDFEIGKAIRGGVPICWPRFGSQDKSMPQHGFSRTAMFRFESAVELDSETTEVRFSLRDDEKSRALWNYTFELEVIFTISKDLSIELKTTNRDSKEFMITQALHTYFAVSNIEYVVIKNLENRFYYDALTDEEYIQNGDVVFTQEVDRVYQGVDKAIILQDSKRVIEVKNSGSSSVVIWNPWIEKGSRMSGMNKEAYKEFVCIESANAFDDFVLLQAGESHSLKALLRSRALE